MISTRRMAAVDRNAEALGVPRKQLMESSGNAVAAAVRDLAAPGSRVAFVCGRGNNGGDAFVAARFLGDYETTTYLLGRPETVSTDIARENWEALGAAEYDTEVVRDSRDFDLGNADVVVDAMLGTGVTGSLREPEASVARAVNDADVTVLAVDVPSGVDADTGEAADVAVDADRVVTFHDQKPGLPSLDAEVTVADIGIPAAAELFVGPGDLQGVGREADSHKGQHGDVLVVGGGPFTGAPAIAAQAVLRAGGDLVNVACPASIAREVQGYGEDLIVRPLDGDRLEPGHVDDLLEWASEKDVVVLGPGLGDADATMDAARRFLEGFDGRGVVDADPLHAVSEVDTDADLICTPNPHEFDGMGGRRVDDWREQADHVAELAAELGHVVLFKRRYDVVSDGETTRVSRSGNPGMTVGGTGDVLAGATAALYARYDPVDAAAVAAYANGRAGDIVYEETGYGYLATDLLDVLPRAMRGDADV